MQNTALPSAVFCNHNPVSISSDGIQTYEHEAQVLHKPVALPTGRYLTTETAVYIILTDLKVLSCK